MKSRRSFLTQSAAVSSAFFGLGRFLESGFASPLGSDRNAPFGDLVSDPEGLLDLPPGFRYTVLSRTGDRMGDGFRVPGQPDGMAAFSLGGSRVALIRNHEIGHSHFQKGPFEDNRVLPDDFEEELVYDAGRLGAQPFVGGTTTLVHDVRTGELVNEFLSLLGTDRNCAGGPTPWGSWITCEEPEDLTSPWGQFHGYCFEVPATATPGLAPPIPLKDMGRFRHEAIAVDPATGVVYLTEDRPDGVLYRFLPNRPGRLAEGGSLQALALVDETPSDSRNWHEHKTAFPIGEPLAVRWIDLDEVDTPADDLRHRALDRGAMLFSRAEGMWYGGADEVGRPSIYFACTDGGRIQTGQIFRYFPSEAEGATGESDAPGEIELYLEPNDTELLKKGDNITISPSGSLYICEDSSNRNMVRGVNREGRMFTLAKNSLNASEFAGACFSPDGGTMYVNIQNPGITFAITGPFGRENRI